MYPLLLTNVDVSELQCLTSWRLQLGVNHRHKLLAWYLQVMLEDGKVVPLEGSLKQRILKDVDSMAERALRCLAFAQKVLLAPCTRSPWHNRYCSASVTSSPSAL